MKTWDNLKFQFRSRGPLMAIFDQLLCCLVWILVITKNHKNGCHGSTIKNKNLQQKLKNTNFGSISNLNMLFTILDSSHYQKSQKWLNACGFNLALHGLLHVNLTWHKLNLIYVKFFTPCYFSRKQ